MRLTRKTSAHQRMAAPPKGKPRWRLKRNWPLYLMLVPGALFVITFNYVPMYGVIIAFQDYQPVHGFTGSRFVGLYWFERLFTLPNFWQILYNTSYIAILKIVLGQLLAIGFALLLNEVRHTGYKRTIQTLVYFPHFLSWVIVGGIFIDLLSSRGLVNQLLSSLGFDTIFFLGSNTWFRPTVIATDLWKSFGWGAILYLAALSNINSELYEAAAIDGANRLRQIWHVTLPGIRPTIVLLAALSLGGVLEAGFEQILMLYNPAVYRTGDIIDTFVYRAGLLDAQYSLATAVGLFKSVIAFILIVISYRLAYRFAGYRIF